MLPEALQVGEHLALKIGLVEAHHKQLHGADHCVTSCCVV